LKRKESLLISFILISLTIGTVYAQPKPVSDYRGDYKNGGTLNLALAEDLSTLNPVVTFKGVDIAIRNLIYPTLLVNDPNWRFDAPWLADSFEVSMSGLNYTFHLNADAKWSDGETITSDDVNFSIHYYMEYDLATSTPHVSNIESVDIPDANTVVINLYKASASWLTTSLFNIFILPEHVWSTIDNPSQYANENPVSAGPFNFVKWEKGQYVELAANDDFWLGRPYIDKIIYSVITSRDSRILAYEQGTIDAVGLLGSDIPKFLNFDDTRIYQTVDPGMTLLGINNLAAPGNDTAFRRAIAHTVDRERIAQTIYFGYAKPNLYYITTPYNASGRWQNPDVAQYPYNLTLAQEMLDAAGYVDADEDGYRDLPDGTPITLVIETTSTITTWIRAAELIVDVWKTIGFDAEVLAVDLGQQINDMMITKNYMFTYYRYGPFSADPGEYMGFASEAQADGGINTAAWINDTYNDLQDQQLVELDEDARRALVHQQLEIYMEEVPNVPTVEGIGLSAVRTTKFGGVINSLPYGPISNLDKYNFMSLYSLDAQVEDEPDPEPEETGGIPGFPYESVLAGLAAAAILVWYVNKNN